MITYDKNNKLHIVVRKFKEAFIPCLLTMVGGNLKILTVSHVIIAAKTGLFTSLACLMIMAFNRFPNNDYTQAWLTGVLVMLADSLSHGPHFTGESLFTGVCAGVLALIVSRFLKS